MNNHKYPYQFFSEELKETPNFCEEIWRSEPEYASIYSGFSFLNLSYFLFIKGGDLLYLPANIYVPSNTKFDIWRISLDKPEYIGDIPYKLSYDDKKLINNTIRLLNKYGDMTIYQYLIDTANSWHRSISLGNEQETEELMKNMGWKDEYVLRDINMPIPDYTLLP